MPEPFEFPPPDSCHKRFVWAYKEVDLVPPPVVGLVVQVGDAEIFPQALGLESLDSFLGVSKQGPGLTAIDDDGDENLNLLAKLKVLLR